jgi:hypothetical protein
MERNERPNIPLLRKAVEWVEEQDKLETNREWYQGGWFERSLGERSGGDHFCDTAYCLAGWVALQAGWTPVFETDSTSLVERNGVIAITEAVAARELGLDSMPAMWLFAASNSAERIRYMAERIAGEKL